MNWKALKINILILPYELATQTRYFQLQLDCLELTVYFIMKLNILEKSERKGRVLGTYYSAPPRINISHSHGKIKGISIRTGQELSFRCNWNFSRLRIDIISWFQHWIQNIGQHLVLPCLVWDCFPTSCLSQLPLCCPQKESWQNQLQGARVYFGSKMEGIVPYIGALMTSGRNWLHCYNLEGESNGCWCSAFSIFYSPGNGATYFKGGSSCFK